MKEISLYFHVPFCTKKCPYCHFFVVLSTPENQEKYMHALSLEWERVRHYLEGYKVVTIYFGGGTPSLLGAEKIQTILSWMQRDGVCMAGECEITLEANPENITLELMKQFKDAGINRVSIGVQSFSDQLLHHIGRTHSAEKSAEAIFATHSAGIDNISIDLMFELPHQSLEQWQKTLGRVSTLPIKHLSLYNLVIEPSTAFYRKKEKISPHIPAANVAKQMLECAVSELSSMGLTRYEISAFAKKGYESQHNVGYWIGRPFFGLGPSAFSYFDGARFSNRANLPLYCKSLMQGQSAIDFREKLPYPDNIKELLAVELRLIRGVDIQGFEKKHAPLSEQMHSTLERLIKEGFLEKENTTVRLSDKGLLFYDTVASEII